MHAGIVTAVSCAMQTLATLAAIHEMEGGTPPADGPDLREGPTVDQAGHCTWQALSLAGAGSWEPTPRRASFDMSCPYLKDRYKCDWDRGWEHTQKWIPKAVRKGKCGLVEGIRARDVEAAVGRKLNILVLGNSLLRELYETIVCEHEQEVSCTPRTVHLGIRLAPTQPSLWPVPHLRTGISDLAL